ncbi:hypothetical protein M409DRAFT_23656 [Zasmidium cellare ATCC 36951]|uniref:NAD-dependent epimerase/dehydratase domain-containing protein n=1 Tax=Zasmidium cellare ATCC 36951 TaxID=1080233 RepID=A0A6A6CFK5_ZASCE|nr:uncharacterized protein M409DRAFT_23656 [Zasmidium cellare ATCC 36951]KAF2165925.1 hypothetical protein M409DRAFT_23656 [Zasmidium cellare ATCC 36951]
MNKTGLRLEPGRSLVLVTGGNGYIGSTILDILLHGGYRVRGTVRSDKPWLQKFFDDKYGPGKFELAIIPDLSVQAEFERALQGVDGIVHVASDLSLDTDAEKVIKGTVAHTINVVKVAARVPSIKSLVLTSSSTACLMPQPGVEGIVIEEDTWNDASVAAASDPKTPKEVLPYTVYAASKTEGERALWKYVKENPVNFAVNTVLPAANYGKILTPEIPGSTMGWVRRLLVGDAEALSITPPQWFVNVEDCAKLHIAALLDPSLNHQRVFAFAEPIKWTKVIEILRELAPKNAKIPNPPPDELDDLSEIKPRDKAEKILREFWGLKGWTGVEESIRDGVEDLL